MPTLTFASKDEVIHARQCVEMVRPELRLAGYHLHEQLLGLSLSHP